MTNNIFRQLMSLHWWMAICYLILLPSGEMVSKIQANFSYHELVSTIHNSFGVLVLLLLDWRIYLLLKVWIRKYSKHLPRLTKNWYFKTCLHTILYLLMLVVPVSGYWLVNATHANDISLFWLPMPDVFPVNSNVVSQARAAHIQTSEAFKILMIIHLIVQYKFIRTSWHRLSSWALTLGGKGLLEKNQVSILTAIEQEELDSISELD
jgi:cytochrome b561